MIPSVIPSMVPSEAHPARNAAALPKTGARSPLAQLLHALNQPLTGLQCSMEVALASPRTLEQYVQGLRTGLELTERMRGLVEAIREVVEVAEEEEREVEEERNEEPQTTELKTLLREVLDDLELVAEGKSVRIALDGSAASCWVGRAGRRSLAAVMFRLLEAALSLALRGTALRIETGGAPAEAWIRVRWHAGPQSPAFSRPELGLLVAQARLERIGAEWERERTENLETVTVRMRRFSAGGGNS
jgi:signal transduction histidine kinase